MEKVKKGILGLSGNPTHFGHIEVAKRAKELLRLDEVILMITPYNPIVPKKYAPFHHRFEMAKMIALESGMLGQGIWLSDFEFNLRPPAGKPQTFDMLRAYETAYPEHQPVWLMGGDSMEYFHKWTGWREIMERFPVVLFVRNLRVDELLHTQAGDMYCKKRVAPREFDAKPGQWTILEENFSSASSTLIRNQLQKGETPTDIPQSVVDYIRKHQLYDALV